jgi:hypothetical protein
MTILTEVVEMTNMLKLDKTVKDSAVMLDRDQARFIVDLYYQLQKYRIALGNQKSALEREDKPNEVVDHFKDQMTTLEKQMTSVLDVYSLASEAGKWARAQVGIGPVIASGFLAHIDITRAPTVGHIWRFAGLDPTTKWEKGQKRPYNAELKTLCWKAGDSFVKQSGRENCYYGKLYKQRKLFEVAKTEAGEHAETARQTLESGRRLTPEQKAYYERGVLPPGRLDLRARRYAVKLFLSHLHHEMFREEYGEDPPMPYPIAHLQHAHYLAPPSGE